ncbi:hypothetical protein [Roseovarius sp.]|uniref:hypothetical protein n=1 Tax=Roseovarius sp. TaxID=1486281 RepID=UPI003BA8CE70
MPSYPSAPAGTVFTSEDRILTHLDGHPMAMRPDNVLTGHYNKLEVEAGSGIAGIAETYKAGVIQMGPLVWTSIFIDLTGLNSNAAGDIIGDDGEANCHLGKITVARNGTLIGGRMSCLETPTGGEPDIDLYSAVESTGTEDAAITGLDETALLAAAADWTGATAPKGLTGLPADGEFLYLVGSGDGTNATYTAGKFLIEFWGYSA